MRICGGSAVDLPISALLILHQSGVPQIAKIDVYSVFLLKILNSVPSDRSSFPKTDPVTLIEDLDSKPWDRNHFKTTAG